MEEREAPSVPSVPLAPPSKPASIYEQSSQSRKWHYAESHLQKIRHAAWETAKDKIIKAWRAEEAAPMPKNAPEETKQAGGRSAASVEEELPKPEEEQQLIVFYMMKLPGITTAFKMPELVQATAMTFMKRFYLRNSCLNYHPKSIMLTCFYLATKVENYPISLGSFAARVAGKDATPAAIEEVRKSVVDLEFTVSQALDFEYAVHGAHRALNGLLIDMLHAGPSSSKLVEELAPEARQNSATSRLTDAELLYTPSQIAYACVRNTSTGKEACTAWYETAAARIKEAKTNEKDDRQLWRMELKAKEDEMKEQLSKKQRVNGKGEAASDVPKSLAEESENGEVTSQELEDQPLGIALSSLEEIAEKAGKMIEAVSVQKPSLTAEKMKDIDRRLKLCQDPAKIPGTKLYIQKQAEREAASAARRKRKAGDVGKAAAGGALESAIALDDAKKPKTES